MTAEQEIFRMRMSLARWLRQRQANDRLGVAPPGRATDEAKLAARLRQLMSEVYDIAIDLDKLSAPELAEIVVNDASVGPTPQGIAPLILLIVIGGAVAVLIGGIRTYADVLAEKERVETCRQTGRECKTDWAKWLAVGAIGWILFGGQIKALGGHVKRKAASSRAGRWLTT